jgi:transglycosylase, SLT family
VGAQRSKRPVRPATRSGLRKIADVSRESPSVRLTRAERGVVQHIARKYRVNASSVEQYMGYARQSGKTYNVDPYLIMAVMATESSFNPRAQSRVGAQGLMQVHTKMHKKRFKPYGSTDTVWEPKVNIQVGSSILSDYLKRYGGSERRALKAYVGAARMSHDGGYGNKVLRRRDEFVSVSVAASNNATSQAMASQADGGRKSVDL